MERDEELGAWIRRQLARRQWSAAQLSRQTGVSPGPISEWISGKRRPNPESCLRLADAFNVDPDFVLALAGHRIPEEPLPPDDTRTRIIALVKRVNMSADRAGALEAVLTAWIEFDRAQTQINEADDGR